MREIRRHSWWIGVAFALTVAGAQAQVATPIPSQAVGMEIPRVDRVDVNCNGEIAITYAIDRETVVSVELWARPTDELVGRADDVMLAPTTGATIRLDDVYDAVTQPYERFEVRVRFPAEGGVTVEAWGQSGWCGGLPTEETDAVDIVPHRTVTVVATPTLAVVATPKTSPVIQQEGIVVPMVHTLPNTGTHPSDPSHDGIWRGVLAICSVMSAGMMLVRRISRR